MIKEGCIRTIVILSPDYLSSPWCGYEANLAFTNSPGEVVITRWHDLTDTLPFWWLIAHEIFGC